MLRCSALQSNKERAVLTGGRSHAGKFRDEKEQVMIVPRV